MVLERLEKGLDEVNKRIGEFDLMKAQMHALLDAVKREAALIVKRDTQSMECKLMACNQRVAALEEATVVV